MVLFQRYEHNARRTTTAISGQLEGNKRNRRRASYRKQNKLPTQQQQQQQQQRQQHQQHKCNTKELEQTKHNNRKE
jgi:hypothetical protein